MNSFILETQYFLFNDDVIVQCLLNSNLFIVNSILALVHPSTRFLIQGNLQVGITIGNLGQLVDRQLTGGQLAGGHLAGDFLGGSATGR